MLRLYVTGINAAVGPGHQQHESASAKNTLKAGTTSRSWTSTRQPSLAKGEQILAVPTLVKKLPLPLRRIVGDMSQKNACCWAWTWCPEEEVEEIQHGSQNKRFAA